MEIGSLFTDNRLMKSLIAITIAFLIISSWDEIQLNLGPQPDLSGLTESDVVLYSTSWCGYCAKMRGLFKKKGIPYFEVDIEKSAEGYRQYKAHKGKGVPLTVVKGTVIKGYKPAAVLSALNAGSAVVEQGTTL